MPGVVRVALTFAFLICVGTSFAQRRSTEALRYHTSVNHPLGISKQIIQESSPAKLIGSWDGMLDAGTMKLKLVLHVTSKNDALNASLDSPDQGATNLSVETVSLTGKTVRFGMTTLGAAYEGELSADGSEIIGKWNQQGQSFPLNFKRRTGAEPESLLKLTSVDVDGHKMNLLVGGKGSPAVIFEGGAGAGIASWSTVQSEIAKSAMTVSYDRAGLGQSQPGPKPRSAKQIATELHAALEKAGVKPPYVLVGHSLGGIFVRVFADMYPKEVAGMVLIDPSQEAFAEWLDKSPHKPKPNIERLSKAPEGLVGEEAALSTSFAQARASKVPAGIPVTLLTAMKEEVMPVEARRMWTEKHKEWVAKVPGARHIIAEKSGHFIQAEEPQLVIDAITKMLQVKGP